ncbi:MAG TPA: extracellular solute-binding protein [Thermoanaerobaculia bacterium]|nr:extracellular solute-binding protein [Thermoanaerobaculia bacterium]
MSPWKGSQLAGGLAALAMFLAAAAQLAGQEKVVIQYDCIPNYANWGGVTAQYQKSSGVRVPPDMKGSSATMAALEAEKANPQADVAYYSGAIGYQAAGKGLHEPYRPKGWEKIPAGLKDPAGKWFTVHTGHIAILVNTAALKGRPVPRSFADLLKPDYKGMVVYDNPTIQGTGFTFVYGVNALLGGAADQNAGFAYLKKLDANILNYAKENSYNDVLRGEIPIWINADGNGLKMKWVDKAPVEVVIAAEGTITMPLVMALVKGAPHRDEAKRYLDWLLGDDAQRMMAESFFVPVVKVQLSPALEKRFLPAEAYKKALVLPLDEMAARADSTKRRWLKEIARPQ